MTAVIRFNPLQAARPLRPVIGEGTVSITCPSCLFSGAIGLVHHQLAPLVANLEPRPVIIRTSVLVLFSDADTVTECIVRITLTRILESFREMVGFRSGCVVSLRQTARGGTRGARSRDERRAQLNNR